MVHRKQSFADSNYPSENAMILALIMQRSVHSLVHSIASYGGNGYMAEVVIGIDGLSVTPVHHLENLKMVYWIPKRYSGA